MRYESKTSFDRFTDMEVVADETEQLALVANERSHNPNITFVAFPEDRDHPIRMTERIPSRWLAVAAGQPRFPSTLLTRPGEYFVAQIGVLALLRFQERWYAQSVMNGISVE